MPSIDNIAEEHVERAAALDPLSATYIGIGGHDQELADLSADGFAERAELDRSTLATLDAAEAPELREQVARAAMAERLALDVERYDAGDTGPNPILKILNNGPLAEANRCLSGLPATASLAHGCLSLAMSHPGGGPAASGRFRCRCRGTSLSFLRR